MKRCFFFTQLASPEVCILGSGITSRIYPIGICTKLLATKTDSYLSTLKNTNNVVLYNS